jgi:RNA polymerase sigma-70 factor (ECF subfamily)
MDPELAASFAEEWPRVVGATLRAFGSLDLAEESAQEAFVRAAERLAAGDPIENIGAWATTTARRIAIDTLRRDQVLRAKLPLLVADDEPQGESDLADDRLGLIFVACDPALSPEQQIALALRIVCGVPTADIADFFGIPEPTVAARLTRAKKAIARAEARFVWPSARHRETRLDEALTTIYGVYTLGHTAVAGAELMDTRLAELAHTLARALVAEHPQSTEALGLLAIIELAEARRGARTTEDGMPLTLAEVDRSAWGRQRVRDGLALAARALPGGGRFALQAGIAGIHSSAASWEETDWGAIATLYHGLKRVWPAPVVTLGSIIARSHLGPAELDRAAEDLRAMRAHASSEMRRRVSAALADVEERRGNTEQALAAFADAAEGENNRALLRFYDRAMGRLRG